MGNFPSEMVGEKVSLSSPSCKLFLTGEVRFDLIVCFGVAFETSEYLSTALCTRK